MPVTPIPMGGGEVNPYPCSEESQMSNWQSVSTNVTNITEVVNNIIDGGVVDTWQVKVSSADTTPEWISEKLQTFVTPAAYDSVVHQPVYAEITAAGGNEGLFLYTAKAGSSQVLVSAADDTPGYLIEKIKDVNPAATYTTDEYQTVYAEITDAAATADENARLYTTRHGVRFVKLTGTITGATSPSTGTVAPPTISVAPLLYSGGNYVTATPNVNVLWPFPEDCVTPSGRFRIGVIERDYTEASQYVVVSYSCGTFPTTV